MAGIGAVLLNALGAAGIDRCRTSESDTVRGWACFMIGAQVQQDPIGASRRHPTLLTTRIFGVRRWAWMALRPHLTNG